MVDLAELRSDDAIINPKCLGSFVWAEAATGGLEAKERNRVLIGRRRRLMEILLLATQQRTSG